MTGELWMTLEGESESGFTKKRIALRMADIDAVEEESVPSKGKRRCRVYTKYRSFTTSSTYDEVLKMMQNGADLCSEQERWLRGED